MFNTLRMQFGGIVCFTPAAGPGTNQGILALLADGRRPAGGHHGAHHPPHVAVLQFFTDQLSRNNQLEPDLYFRRRGSRREEALLFLVHEDLEIEGTAGKPAPRLVGGRSNDDAPTDSFEERDFHWVADCSRLGVSGLKAGCVERAYGQQGAPDSLLARFVLRGGVLSAGAVAKPGGVPSRAVFHDRAHLETTLPTYRQALALWADWEVPVPPGNVTIRLTSFKTGAHRRLVLSSAVLPFGGSMWAAVKNVTMTDLLEVSDIIEPGRPPGLLDSHFDLHYALSDPMPDPAWIPDAATVTDGKPSCPPTELNLKG